MRTREDHLQLIANMYNVGDPSFLLFICYELEKKEK